MTNAALPAAGGFWASWVLLEQGLEPEAALDTRAHTRPSWCSAQETIPGVHLGFRHPLCGPGLHLLVHQG